MTCKKCRWFKDATKSKKLFNNAWDLKKYDGFCMFEPHTAFKFEDDFCSHYEEKKDEHNNKD